MKPIFTLFIVLSLNSLHNDVQYMNYLSTHFLYAHQFRLSPEPLQLPSLHAHVVSRHSFLPVDFSFDLYIPRSIKSPFLLWMWKCHVLPPPSSFSSSNRLSIVESSIVSFTGRDSWSLCYFCPFCLALALPFALLLLS